MYLVTIDCREVAGRPGAVTGTGEILDLAAAPSTLSEAQWIPQSVISILAAGEDGLERTGRLLAAAEAAPERLRAAGALLALGQTRLMAPVRRPGLVLVCGAVRPAAGEPDPVAFIKSPNTVAGHASEVRVPWPAEAGVEISAMPAVVLGRSLHRATEREAARAVAGFTLLLDVSLPAPAAAAPAEAWRRYLDSKQFPGACPVGPSIVTSDSVDTDRPLVVVDEINGVAGAGREVSLANLPSLLAALSRRYGFRPGDLVGLASPEGAPDARRQLRDGDRIRVRLVGHMDLEATIHCPA